MVQSEDEGLLLVKPPYLFTVKKFLRKDVLYKPEKAIFGFMNFVLEPLQSEPNLWKLQNAGDEDDLTVYGLFLTYVDDLLIAAPDPLMLAVQNKIRSTWATSVPEPVSSTPVCFLGMEISKLREAETTRDVWMLTKLYT